MDNRELAKSRIRRLAEATGFVAIWAFAGLALRLDANQYLLLGISLTLFFQLFVRRQPLRALWVREAPSFELGRAGWANAVILAVVPAWLLVRAARAGEIVIALWALSAMFGAVAAGYARERLTPTGRRELLLCAAVAGSIGIAIMAGGAHLRGMMGRFHWQVFSFSLAEYFPVSFVIEEVSFRGVLDAHVHHPGESRGWMSAVFVSALWGLWHLPITPAAQNLPAAALILITHCAIGVPLSIFWRRSGNLAVPAFSHALIDAVRNAL